MKSEHYFILFGLLVAFAGYVLANCEKNGKTYKVGESYTEDCDVYTCKKQKKKFKFAKTFNETHCCKHDGKDYKVGEYFNTTRLNVSCSVSELSCVSVKNFTLPAVVIDVVHHNNCCAYNHRARAGPWEYFDEYYNQTMLDRYKNFTLFLEIGHNVTLPEKCMNLTCRQIEGVPVLSPEYVHRSCNCCIYNGTLFPDGARNITMEDGRNASCCNGELVIPLNVNGTGGGGGQQQQQQQQQQSLDSSLCWSSCFKSDNAKHNKFLEIIQKLQKEQTDKNCKGTAFILDGSLSSQKPVSIYNYERNLAILLSMTLPINSSNPFFASKYQNYGSCSKYYADMQCKTSTCSAATTLSGHSHMNSYEPISTDKMQLGMMWHGTALAQQALLNQDTGCTTPHSNELVVVISNKQWINNGVGGGNGYHPNWEGPDAYGRTVASIGIDQAQQYQQEALSSRNDLVWMLESDDSWRQELRDLVTCLDTSCCNGAITSSGGGVPKTYTQTAVVGINGTDIGSVEWLGL